MKLNIVKKIKIIGGKWKGRKILVTSRVMIRPTTNRIREMLFSWINPVISGAVCLDCFAGTGALGLEALSRGASRVTFLDNNHLCINALMKVIQSFIASNSSDVIYTDCRVWLQKSIATYDIVFIDPPFRDNVIISEVIFLLERYNHFKDESWVYIESSKYKDISDINTIPNYWTLYKKKLQKMLHAISLKGDYRLYV